MNTSSNTNVISALYLFCFSQLPTCRYVISALYLFCFSQLPRCRYVISALYLFVFLSCLRVAMCHHSVEFLGVEKLSDSLGFLNMFRVSPLS